MPISPKMSEKDSAETYARLQHIATVPQVVDTSKMVAGVTCHGGRSTSSVS